MKNVLQNITKKIKYTSIIVLFLSLPFGVMSQVEICDNGIDDDNDSLIDLNDEDCICEIIEPTSLIPNPSFEETNCCPNDRSQLECAKDWIQASEPTTDFIHQCGWLGWSDFPPPQPFPDGEGILGFRDGMVRTAEDPEPNWKEYAGACLLSPLRADSLYRLQFDLGFVDPEKSPPIDITFYGTSSCDYLPFGVGNSEFGCPSNSSNWQKLDEVRVSGGAGDIWITTTLDVVPQQDIYAIAIGPDCDDPKSQNSLYYFFDNLLLTNLEFFDLQISEISHLCSNEFTLSVPFNPDFQYQWYLSGVALEGEIFSELTQNYGEGPYQVRIIKGETCRTSAAYEYIIPMFDTPVKQVICDGEFYDFGELELSQSGIYIDTFLTVDDCDSIVQLELEVIGESYDTIRASILAGETYEIGDYAFKEEGDYPLTFTSTEECDSLVLLILTVFNNYIPNVFSPNQDGLNDVFEPFVSFDGIRTVDMKIYDRWGNLLYQGPAWDGYDVEPNVFVYVISVDLVHGGTRMFYGSVTLVK